MIAAERKAIEMGSLNLFMEIVSDEVQAIPSFKLAKEEKSSSLFGLFL